MLPLLLHLYRMCWFLHATLIQKSIVQMSVQHNLSFISNYNVSLEGTVSWEKETILAGLNHISTLVTNDEDAFVPLSNI